MIISKKQFLELPSEHREQIIAALFEAQHPNFTKEHVGVDIDVPAGYSVRVAAILACELPKEIVKKLFVLQQDSNDFITKLDLEEFSEYAVQLKKTGIFDPERDDLWVISSGKWKFSAYNNMRGKIIFSDIGTLLKGIEEKYNTNRELRDVLRHYGFVKEKDTESF